MKRSKKIFILFISFLAIYLLVTQVYYIFKNDGNLIVYLTNESFSDSLTVELFLDDELIAKDFLANEVIFFNKYTFNVNPTAHSFKIKINNDMSREIKIYTFFVTWVIIEYFDPNQRSYPNIGNPFLIDIKKCSPTMIN